MVSKYWLIIGIGMYCGFVYIIKGIIDSKSRDKELEKFFFNLIGVRYKLMEGLFESLFFLF